MERINKYIEDASRLIRKLITEVNGIIILLISLLGLVEVLILVCKSIF